MAPSSISHERIERRYRPARARRILARRRMTTSTSGGVAEGGDECAEVDRLRSASLLSAGLAHEVANPLLVVLSNLAEIERIYPRLRALMGSAQTERWEELADSVHEAHR